MEILAKKFFSYYTDEQPAMAASLSSIKYCIKTINTFKLNKILDLGSGLSTLAFLANNYNVTSVDNDSKWSFRTEEVIKEILDIDFNILNNIELVLDTNFDFIFYDYGNLEDRIFNFPKLLQLNANFIYLDDLHILPYRYYIESKLKAYRLIFLAQTTDEFGRFGGLLVSNDMSF